MKKIVVSIAAAFIISLGFSSIVSAEGQGQAPGQKVNLTEDQKAELGKLHEQMYSTKKELVKKYVEYGVFTKEQGDKVLNMMEAKHQKLKENGYMMRWHPHPHHGKQLDHKE
ncbi:MULTISPECIES: YckD family protein [unclassified Rossellomorea]|uniref:YckD family protein n=1 Tax=unclassified Rossellomorea TaxID=2837526 RepID=UPI0020C66A57|nr:MULTISPECIES: YckD family protein [unclassified Rossellomorea]UTE75880.1 YckD family protein [Rossellomorea sp. KS-H15a]WGG43709.1 YckD family protein [Rossellomorea sp. DA94]